MYIESVKNRNSPPCILLRESHREGDKVHKRTVANLTDWDPRIVEGLRGILKGGTVSDSREPEILRTLAHGHVTAVLQTIRKLGLDRTISGKSCMELKLVLAMIIERILAPNSKLATSQDLSAQTASTTVLHSLGLEGADEQDLYRAMDWLLERQEQIEDRLAAKHLQNGSVVLYDLTSCYMEGTKCPLSKLGYSRDGKPGKLQIEYGLLCDESGLPVAVKVFEGNTSDPATVADQVAALRGRFGLSRVILVGDRGMLTQARITEDLQTRQGIDWISALRAPAIQSLIAEGTIQPELFDTMDLAEVTSEDFPNERLVVCKNPFLTERRRLKREELLKATEKLLDAIVLATRREKNPLRGAAKIGVRLGRILSKYKMGKHFTWDITEDTFRYQRNQQSIDQESLSDGLYVIRSTVPADVMSEAKLVGVYKSLSQVERAFRTMKTIDLKVRPIYHWHETRVRAHVFLCMLAYYVEWHMRQSLAPILYQDDDKEQAQAKRTSIVAPASTSERAKRKAAAKKTEEGFPVFSFRTALQHLGSIAMNWISFGISTPPITKVTTPTLIQRRILDLLGVHF